MKKTSLWGLMLACFLAFSCEYELVVEEWNRPESIACYLNGQKMEYGSMLLFPSTWRRLKVHRCPSSLEAFGTTVDVADADSRMWVHFALKGAEDLAVDMVFPRSALRTDVILTDEVLFYVARQKDRTFLRADDVVLVLKKDLEDGEFSAVVPSADGTLFLTNGQLPRLVLE